MGYAMAASGRMQYDYKQTNKQRTKVTAAGFEPGALVFFNNK